MKSFLFGFDIDNIEKVMDYVKKNYKEDVDFKMWIGRGDDYMNCLDVLNDVMLNDNDLIELIEDCEEFVEE